MQPLNIETILWPQMITGSKIYHTLNNKVMINYFFKDFIHHIHSLSNTRNKFQSVRYNIRHVRIQVNLWVVNISTTTVTTVYWTITQKEWSIKGWVIRRLILLDISKSAVVILWIYFQSSRLREKHPTVLCALRLP